MFNDYTCQQLHDAKRRDFMEDAEHARLLKQVETSKPGGHGLRQVRVPGVAAVVPVVFLLSFFVMNGLAGVATPAQSSAATPMVIAIAGTGDSGQPLTNIGNSSTYSRIYEKWRSLPAPYNHNVAELNDMMTYDTPQATDARAQKVWEQEPAPYNRSISELNALKQDYRDAAGLP
jgi:hypothetical protein